MTARIKKGDRVYINCGKDNGKSGEVIKVLGTKALVKDVNVYKKHQKQDQNNEGGILNKEMPVNISNLMLIDKKSNNIKIEVENSELAPRYSGIVIDDINLRYGMDTLRWAICVNKKEMVTKKNSFTRISCLPIAWSV